MKFKINDVVWLSIPMSVPYKDCQGYVGPAKILEIKSSPLF